MSAVNEFGRVWGGNSVGGHKCSYQAANRTISRRNLRPREGVSSNLYLPAMDRYLGFSVSLPIAGQGESGHCNPLSLPSQLWELPRRPSPPSVSAPTPREPCSYTALHAQ